AVDALSFRPGDVLHARNGKTVEIHNTDAEGRLVLGDALDVAVTQKGKDKPRLVIDAATLTGAIKVGLGSNIGGLFSNNDSLARVLEKSSQGAGDPLWRMPLDQSLRAKMKSHVADMTNAVDALSFRPGDVLHARNGKTVEIHNTDAEGRLVLGDALDVAVTQKGKDKPRLVIDAATLTGAIKVGLGSNIGGLFSNNDSLARVLEKSSQGAGDPLWRMPLDQSLRAKMKSHVADMTNAVDGFGGAITAALFLESFIGDIPWAHMDLYAWTDGSRGAYSRAGANGQGVQTLGRFLTRVSEGEF
ncbi:MAG: hypothetical protein VYD54_07240, partial [Bdellovibrionota bacterium]|nr:hypothetical protein [Bdellovibrionota bacterium]